MNVLHCVVKFPFTLLFNKKNAVDVLDLFEFNVESYNCIPHKRILDKNNKDIEHRLKVFLLIFLVVSSER